MNEIIKLVMRMMMMMTNWTLVKRKAEQMKNRKQTNIEIF